MDLFGELESNNTSNIGMLHSALKYVFIIFSDQWIKIINNKDRSNGIKGSTKIQKR